MNNSSEKVAYIRGFLKAGAPEDELTLSFYEAVTSALEALAGENRELNGRIAGLEAANAELSSRLAEQSNSVDELCAVCDELDLDLADVENRLGITGEEDEMTLSDDDYYTEMVCPDCGLHFFCHDSILSTGDEIACPDCGGVIPVEPVDDNDDVDDE